MRCRSASPVPSSSAWKIFSAAIAVTCSLVMRVPPTEDDLYQALKSKTARLGTHLHDPLSEVDASPELLRGVARWCETLQRGRSECRGRTHSSARCSLKETKRLLKATCSSRDGNTIYFKLNSAKPGCRGNLSCRHQGRCHGSQFSCEAGHWQARSGKVSRQTVCDHPRGKSMAHSRKPFRAG